MELTRQEIMILVSCRECGVAPGESCRGVWRETLQSYRVRASPHWVRVKDAEMIAPSRVSRAQVNPLARNDNRHHGRGL